MYVIYLVCLRNSIPLDVSRELGHYLVGIIILSRHDGKYNAFYNKV